MQNKTIVVVGGSHGIGAGVIQRVRAAGASTVCLARTMGEFQADPQNSFVEFDVTKDDIAAEQLPATIDGFVYCPGSINLGTLRSLNPQVVRDDFELNVIGAVRTLKAALPGLKAAGQSSAVFFSTVAVAQGLPMHTSIAGSKGALEAMVRTWATELAPSTRVNCIAPALTDTPLAEKFLSTDDKRAAMSARYPLGRVGSVDDMAAMAEFLLSDQAGWITGQVLNIDGGMSKCRT